MFTWQGSEYDFDIDKITVEEARQIKRKYTFTIAGLLEALREVDPDAMTCLYWLVMRSDGKHDDLVLSDDLNFPIVEFGAAWAASLEEGEPDPTPDGSPQGSTTPASTGSSPVTWTPSPVNTSIPSPGSAVSASGKPDGSPSEDLSRM